MSYTFNVPTKVLFGAGALARKAVGIVFACDPSDLSDDDVLAILRASYR